MPLKPYVATLEEIPDGFQGEYAVGKLKTGEEVFILQVEPINGWALEDVTGLKSGLQSERRAHGTASRFLEGLGFVNDDGLWSGGDFDLDALQTSASELVEMKKIDPEKEAGKLAEQIAKGQVEQVQRKAEREMSAKQAQLDNAMSQLEKNIRRRAITDAIAKHDGRQELLTAQMMAETRVVERDGVFITEVLDPNGDARITMRPGSTDPMTPEERVAEMKQQDAYAPAFKGSGREGMGTQSPAPGTKTTTSPGTVRRIARGDQGAMNDDILGLASGKTSIQ